MSPSMDTHSLASYLRIIAVSFAAYDYFLTLPPVWRFYQSHWRARRISFSLVFLLLLRFFSISVLTLSTIGFFYMKFDEKSCKAFHLLPPIFKVLQAVTCEAILGFRAFNLSRRSSSVGKFLALVFTATVVIQGISTLSGRQPQVDPAVGNCLAYSPRSDIQSAYVHYVAAIAYDVITISISCFFLLKHKRSSHSSVMSRLIRVMFIDGTGYFIALTCVNTLNLLLYRTHTSSELQSAAVALSYAFIWIMSSRLILHMHEASLKRRTTQALGSGVVTVTHHLDAAKDISHALRSQFDTKGSGVISFSRLGSPSFESERVEHVISQPEHSVHVRVEKTVKLSRAARPYQLESYQSGGARSFA